jgi:4-amino-4-deoxy-L-arabinose transferase-like glycosyltransferase
MLSRWLSSLGAFLAAAVVVSFPIAVVSATIPTVDIAELGWAVAAFWLFYGTDSQRRSHGLYSVLAGVCIAAAFSSRETVAAFILVMGIQFLVGHRIPRSRFLLAGIGCVLAIGAEMSYYWIAAGDPLLRFKLLLQGTTGWDGDRPAAEPFTWDSTGAYRIHWLVDTLVMFVTKHHFGVFYPVILALLAVLCIRPSPSKMTGESPVKAIGRDALAMGIVWTLFAIWALLNMKLMGRYYLTPTYFILVGLVLLASNYEWRSTWVTAIVAILLAGNLIGIAIENRNPKLAERAAAASAREFGISVITDPKTAYYAEPYLNWNGLPRTAIVGRPPRPGDLYLHGVRNTSEPNRFVAAGELASYLPAPSWELVRDYSDRPLVSGRFAEWIRDTKALPAYVESRLTESRSKALLYRVRLE